MGGDVARNYGQTECLAHHQFLLVKKKHIKLAESNRVAKKLINTFILKRCVTDVFNKHKRHLCLRLKYHR